MMLLIFAFCYKRFYFDKRKNDLDMVCDIKSKMIGASIMMKTSKLTQFI